MPEQPQWPERTLDMPPQDPWADPPTAPGPTASFPPPTAPFPQPEPNPFSRGRAQVNPQARRPQHHQHHTAVHEPTGTGWPGAEPSAERRPLGWHIRELRKGGEWTSAALLFAFVCWGVWAISTDGDLTTPIVVFISSLFVAAGLFALCRVIGRFVLEHQLHRERRSARGSHMVTAVFLAGVGIAHLRQTEWVMDAYHWVVGTF